jgi:hypothetical protein
VGRPFPVGKGVGWAPARRVARGLPAIAMMVGLTRALASPVGVVHLRQLCFPQLDSARNPISLVLNGLIRDAQQPATRQSILSPRIFGSRC